ncbi:MAG: ParB/RepB/Spo0J family partition protein [Amphiplicatus sp.]
MDDAGIDELARSIEEKGILQPLLVRRLEGETEAFEIIAGERRWRAAQRAKVHEVPVLVKDLSDEEVLEVALIENLQRQDLSALEEAEGYRRLMEEFRHTQEDLAKVVGKSRSHVANMMRLLGLPDTVKTLLAAGALSAGHARALLNAKEPMKLAKKVVNRGLSVRQTEILVQKETDQQTPTRDFRHGQGREHAEPRARPDESARPQDRNQIPRRRRLDHDPLRLARSARRYSAPSQPRPCDAGHIGLGNARDGARSDRRAANLRDVAFDRRPEDVADARRYTGRDERIRPRRAGEKRAVTAKLGRTPRHRVRALGNAHQRAPAQRLGRHAGRLALHLGLQHDIDGIGEAARRP